MAGMGMIWAIKFHGKQSLVENRVSYNAHHTSVTVRQ
jgi:hypothetical protein